jgi:DNA-binding ferritin-like protein
MNDTPEAQIKRVKETLHDLLHEARKCQKVKENHIDQNTRMFYGGIADGLDKAVLAIEEALKDPEEEEED